jgi:hypothetical protein
MKVELRHWRIALPWLGEMSRPVEEGPAMPSLDWLLARADRSPARPAWREWLLEDAGLGDDVLQRFPAGPCVRAAWTGGLAAGCWACAAPVHLLAGLDHLRLAAPAPLPIEDDASAALAAGINEHLADSGFTLVSVPRRGWLCECPQDLDCDASEPAAAVGGNLRDWLPAGRDARRVRAWVNEAQMILHEHPLNEQRMAHGDPPVNSVWLWGFGLAGQRTGNTESILLTDDDWLKGLWRLHSGTALEIAELDSSVAPTGVPGTTRIAIASRPQDRAAAERPSQAVPRLLETVRTALESGTVARVSIHTGSEVLDLDRRARWRFWRRPKALSGPPE